MSTGRWCSPGKAVDHARRTAIRCTSPGAKRPRVRPAGGRGPGGHRAFAAPGAQPRAELGITATRPAAAGRATSPRRWSGSVNPPRRRTSSTRAGNTRCGPGGRRPRRTGPVRGPGAGRPRRPGGRARPADVRSGPARQARLRPGGGAGRVRAGPAARQTHGRGHRRPGGRGRRGAGLRRGRPDVPGAAGRYPGCAKWRNPAPPPNRSRCRPRRTRRPPWPCWPRWSVRVAALVMEGATNREIAARLFISVKTVGGDPDPGLPQAGDPVARRHRPIGGRSPRDLSGALVN